MPTVSCESAQKVYGITCEHEQLPSGELRFRLKSASDETAYIRTVAASTGGWQQSHYHSKVKETYIVQSAWIGYAELLADLPRYFIFQEGQMFTTPPEVIHNVYMPVGALIHTVKHGRCVGEARLVDERTKRFDDDLSRVSEADLLQRAEANTKAIAGLPDFQSAPQYSDAYRHFDTLIWQVPAWTTAIFAVVFAGMAQVTSGSPILDFVGLNATGLMAAACGLFGFFVLALSHALYRFRWHQVRAKSYTPEHPLRSPQVLLQLLANVQSLVLLLLATQGTGLRISNVVGVLLLIFGGITFYQERELIREGRKDSKPIRTES